MRRLNSSAACLVVCLCGVPLSAAGPTLAEARQRLLRGNYEEARVLYETLARESESRDPKGGAYATAIIGLSRALEGLAGADYARWHNLSDQFQVILNDVLGDALKNEKEFWPAENEAGTLLLEKYNRGEALDAFDKALTINPNAAEALVGKGLAALQKFEVQAAQQFADHALRINAKLPEALRLRADAHVVAGDLKAARKDLDQARKINPRDENTLG